MGRRQRFLRRPRRAATTPAPVRSPRTRGTAPSGSWCSGETGCTRGTRASSSARQAAPTIELAFVDLAGFRAFNNRYGQDMGDEVLRAFAEEIGALPTSRAVRDGGDEFLIVGTPTRSGIDRDVRALCASWPERFRRRFGTGAPPVAARILVGEARAKDLGGLPRTPRACAQRAEARTQGRAVRGTRRASALAARGGSGGRHHASTAVE